MTRVKEAKIKEGRDISLLLLHHIPVNDVFLPEIVQSKSDLTDVELDVALFKPHLLLDVEPQVAAQQEVNHHEHVLLILKGEPQVDEEGMVKPR